MYDSKPLILLVDDDHLVLATLTSGLINEGYNVVAASSADEAIEKCNQLTPSLAIVDLRMPGTSGLELAKILREQYSVHFIVFTAYGERESIEKAVSCGALGYLVKPLDIPQVIPTIEAALQRARELDAIRESEENLRIALAQGREISVAIGVLMERYRLQYDEAFDQLRAYSRSKRRKVSEVSADIIRGVELINAPFFGGTAHPKP